MTVNSVTSASQMHQVAAQPAPVRQKPQQAKAAAPAEDTVQLSQAAVAALKAKPAESTETFDQTLKEANAGDPKALAKLAKKH